ncbi:hypothetical protein GVAMD_1061 [Gardnerella vaginalis AMD]|nr:hypothetical protein GVAMD_1061 [Gardnerella vaginalis AMD]EIK79199.1 hypothetical protein CGSMWGv6420B_02511 [Gardnerella vaginalis 6420B]
MKRLAKTVLKKLGGSVGIAFQLGIAHGNVVTSGVGESL